MKVPDTNHKDYRSIMAYIDGTLSEKDRVRFESRLASSSDLKNAILEQKRLKAALRALPIKKAPRDFMLSPEMIRQHKAVTPMFPAFRFAAVIAAILLVVLFTGERYILPAIQSARITESSESVMVNEIYAPMAKDAAESPVIITWNDTSAQTNVYGVGGSVVGMGGGADLLSPEQTTILSSEEPSRKEQPEVSIQSEPISEPVLEPEPESVLSAEPEAESEITASEPLILGINQDEAGQVISQSIPEAGVPQPWLGLTLIYWAEIGLGALALVLGITAILLRRRV